MGVLSTLSLLIVIGSFVAFGYVCYVYEDLLGHRQRVPWNIRPLLTGLWMCSGMIVALWKLFLMLRYIHCRHVKVVSAGRALAVYLISDPIYLMLWPLAFERGGFLETYFCNGTPYYISLLCAYTPLLLVNAFMLFITHAGFVHFREKELERLVAASPFAQTPAEATAEKKKDA